MPEDGCGAGASRPGSSGGPALPSCPGRWPRRAGSHRAAPTLCPCRVRTRSRRAAARRGGPHRGSERSRPRRFRTTARCRGPTPASSTPSWMAGAATSPRAGAFSGRRHHCDARVLHIPEKFDARRPAVMIVFFHGHGATLERDVRDRQRVPEQISHSGANARARRAAVRGRRPGSERGQVLPAGRLPADSSTRPPSSRPNAASRARRERSRRCPSWSWPTAAGTCRPRGA